MAPPSAPGTPWGQASSWRGRRCSSREQPLACLLFMPKADVQQTTGLPAGDRSRVSEPDLARLVNVLWVQEERTEPWCSLQERPQSASVSNSRSAQVSHALQNVVQSWKLLEQFSSWSATQLLCICSRSEQVEVNFGQKPFAFDLDALVQEERSKREAAVQRWDSGSVRL